MPEVPYDAIIGNLASPSQPAAIKALSSLLTQEGDDAPALATRIAKSLQENGKISVTVPALQLLQPWRDVPEVLDVAGRSEAIKKEQASYPENRPAR